MSFETNNATKQPKYDTILGTDQPSNQYGLIGERSGRKVALDLNHPLTISLFGVQGAGKSYSLGAIAEMAVTSIPGINQLSHPLATVVFHYSATQNYPPEFCSMTQPNTDAQQIEQLKTIYGAEPKSLDDVVMLTPVDQLAARRQEFPDIKVRPILFSSTELGAMQWRFILGAIGNHSQYIRDTLKIIRRLGDRATLSRIRDEIYDSSMSDGSVRMAMKRLDFAEQYIDDAYQISSAVKPGRVVIVDIRDPFVDKDEALGLFLVLMSLFAEVQFNDQHFNKLIIFDECHKYIDDRGLIKGLVESVREMRHKGTSVVIASQDPPSVPVELIELSSVIFLHKFNSPAWLKHLKQANAALKSLSDDMMHNLLPGEAYVWANKSSEINFTRQPFKVVCRPRVTKHGGDSVLATQKQAKRPHIEAKKPLKIAFSSPELFPFTF